MREHSLSHLWTRRLVVAPAIAGIAPAAAGLAGALAIRWWTKHPDVVATPHVYTSVEVVLRTPPSLEKMQHA